jgi:lipopolysaccharide transport system ATP-binding protein
LLKILAGTLNASSGDVSVVGKLAAILELGTGFHMEQTGRENILLGGMCLGMSRAEVERKMGAIIAFSELESVIDQPFRTYSSGMQARLSFSTAISIEPEVLIIDEALAAGDSYFVAKCLERISEICSSGATVLLVSHTMELLKRICGRMIWIDEGNIRLDGDPFSVALAYEREVLLRRFEHDKSQEKQNAIVDAAYETGMYMDGSGEVEITKVELVNADGVDTNEFKQFEPLTVRIHWRGHSDKKDLNPVFRIENSLGLHATGSDGKDDGLIFDRLDGAGFWEARMDCLRLGAGEYFLTVGIRRDRLIRAEGDLLCALRRCRSFRVIRKLPHASPVPYVYEEDIKWGDAVAEQSKEKSGGKLKTLTTK